MRGSRLGVKTGVVLAESGEKENQASQGIRVFEEMELQFRVESPG